MSIKNDSSLKAMSSGEFLIVSRVDDMVIFADGLKEFKDAQRK